MNSTDIAFADAAEQARMLATGTVTSTAFTELYLERIARLNAELGAYSVVLAETARTEAAAAQQRLDEANLDRCWVCLSPYKTTSTMPVHTRHRYQRARPE